jgi:hypothetical protein
MQDAAPIAPAVPGQLTRVPGATEVWRATREHRSELRNQMEVLEEKRNDLTRELASSETPEAAKPGLVERLKVIDTRITAVEGQIAEADAAVAKAAAVPGAVQEPPLPVRHGPPEEVWILSGIFIVTVLMPIALAYARRIWKRGATVIAPVPREVQGRLDELANAVESIGLEVERIGEGQRFITRVFSEQRQADRLPAAER